MKKLFLTMCLLSAMGCASAEQVAAKKAAEEQAAAQEEARFKAKIDKIKNKKVVNIRIEANRVDLITDEGDITTIYAESYNCGGSYVPGKVGIK
jgi:hypothetical protein